MFLTESLFCEKKQIQTIRYGLNDSKRIKKKQVTLKFYSFSSDFNVQSDFGKKIHKNSIHFDHSYLKYTLAIRKNLPF